MIHGCGGWPCKDYMLVQFTDNPKSAKDHDQPRSREELQSKKLVSSGGGLLPGDLLRPTINNLNLFQRWTDK